MILTGDRALLEREKDYLVLTYPAFRYVCRNAVLSRACFAYNVPMRREWARMQRKNSIVLSGVAGSDPVFLYPENRSVGFTLEVMRDSGVYDRIAVRAGVPAAKDIKAGDRLSLSGRIITENHPQDTEKRLEIYVAAVSFSDFSGFENEVHVTGFICKKPLYRRTPSGREVCEVVLAVSGGGVSYIPCIAWGDDARALVKLKTGDLMSLEGRLQSREYRKRTENGNIVYTVCEVSISRY